MSEHNEPFLPEWVDEQIDALTRPAAQSTPHARLISNLQAVYHEDTEIVERVQKRLAGQLAERRRNEMGKSDAPSVLPADLRKGPQPMYTLPSDQSNQPRRFENSEQAMEAKKPGEFANPELLERSERAGRRERRLERRRSHLLEILAAVLVIAALLGGTTFILRSKQGATLTSPTISASPFTPGSYRSIDSRLFSNTSPWNVPIGTTVQLDPNSSAMVSQLSVCCHVPSLFRYGMPIYTSTASDPTYTVQDPGHDSLFASYQPIHIPNDAAPSPGSDHWMFIYDKTKNLIFEMWDTSKSGNNWNTNKSDVYSPTGDGVLQVDGSHPPSNGASYFGGVVTDADIQRGFINHALSLAVGDTASTWRYPMNASDGHGTDAGAVPMGARLQLDPSVDCNTLPGALTGEKMICQALKTYGGYVRDSGTVTLGIYFEGEDLTDPTRNPPNGSPGNPGQSGGIYTTVGLQDGKDFATIPWDKLRVLKAWNSFTALKTPPSLAPQAFQTLPAIQAWESTSVNAALNLPSAAPLVIGEDANKRRLLNSMPIESV